MISKASIVQPARLEGLYKSTQFIPANSKDQLIEVDMGFNTNPVFRQEKLCYFLSENLYYQQLILVDGKRNAIKDDARTLVVSGWIEEPNPVNFELDIFPALPVNADINRLQISLPFYPELNTGIVIRDNSRKDIFYHFTCNKMVYRPGALSYLQLRCVDQYQHKNLAAVLHKWHPYPIMELVNIVL
jgi:hypothetical protein